MNNNSNMQFDRLSEDLSPLSKQIASENRLKETQTDKKSWVAIYKV